MAAKLPKVMKPKRLDDLAKYEGNMGYIMEPKYDGYRTLTVIGDEVQLFTRLGNEKTEQVPFLVRALEHMRGGGHILDGEIIVPHQENLLLSDFTAVKRIMGSGPDEAVRKQLEGVGEIHLMLFDILQADGKPTHRLPFWRRRRMLSDLMSDFLGDLVHLSPVSPVDSGVIESYIEGGMEGVVIKNLHSPYVFGKKPSQTWYKVKMQDTIDAVVMGFLPAKKGTGWAEEGLIGSIIFGQYINGELIKRGTASGMDMDTRLMLSANPSQYINRVVEIKHMGLTPIAVRHPQFLRFRDDKLPGECYWEVPRT